MRLKKSFSTIVFILIAVFIYTDNGHALPVISQVGNLISNGNFESGTETLTTGTGASAFTSWNQWKQPSNINTVTTQLVTSPLIEGNYSARISGDLDAGLFQYSGLTSGAYTVSGWVYVVSGSAHLGMAWDSGYEAEYSSSVNTSDQWTYLQATVNVTSTLGGPLVYAASNSSVFYAEGIWFNVGNENTSPFRPEAGFDPNQVNPVPEPAAVWLLGAGLLGLCGIRSKTRCL